MTATLTDRRRAGDDPSAPLLEVDDLTVAFGDGPGSVRAVENVSLSVGTGEIYALVGESGCGKSTLGYSLLGIVPPPGRIAGGDVRFRGRSTTAMPKNELNGLRGSELSMVFQGAMNAFNPVLTIGTQVEHILAAHPGRFSSDEEGKAYFEHLLELVQLPPERIWKSFESQLSGGMKQRVAIAVALLLKPSLVVLDEPTTALDVLNQRLVIDILKELHRELGVTIIFVTHDLAVVAELATRVAVMYAGRLVESGTVDEIFGAGRRHPYVEALINAIPSVLDSGLRVKPIGGSVPNLARLPQGCRFAPRCSLAEDLCRSTEPPLVGDAVGHLVSCHVVNRGLDGDAAGADSNGTAPHADREGAAS
ncbi:peptide/nickel transport system ATP-binding protein [Friedmanniella endophytica]|uniref:Peptide/nickel transport system ATP-binding protein n=1 Tax=Microlunatus kandeliicorticis TaxID=1759536 RepID=A0A7W3IQ57_9ACTN|nr:ABC transporter ATP-binding protein [Microlunatus kandeliicorticis]MBA8793192.1 peptide/nickel transport system ATP-binding protein [Microlunatus kandeliicorticis]